MFGVSVTFPKLSVLLGLLFALPTSYGVLKPAAFAQAARKFPRSEAAGYFLMTLATLWFLYNVNNEATSDFADYKRYMLIGFGAMGVLTCVFVTDYLSVRALSILLLLLAWFTLNLARWADSPWRLVVVVWAYVWVISGMWFAISPWRLRDFLNWSTASERRTRISNALQLLVALLVAVLGLTVF